MQPQAEFRITLMDVMRSNFYQIPRALAVQVFIGVLVVWRTWVFMDAVRNLDTGLLVKVLTFIVMEVSFLAIIVAAGAAALLVLSLLCCLPGLNKNILTDWRVILSDEGVVVETPHNRTEAKWSGIQRVSQNRDYIILQLTQTGGWFIPKRALATGSEIASFYNYILSHWKTARGNRQANAPS